MTTSDQAERDGQVHLGQSVYTGYAIFGRWTKHEWPDSDSLVRFEWESDARVRAGRLDDHGDEEAALTGAGRAEVDDRGSVVGRGQDVAAVCRERGVSEQTYHRWRNQFGGLKADDAKRLKDLERENSTLKRLLADAELEKAVLKEIAKGNF